MTTNTSVVLYCRSTSISSIYISLRHNTGAKCYWHLFSTAERQKKEDKIKLFRETNDEAEIPIQKTNGITKIYKIIIILRNILIVNISLFV
ncbi:unnamed protein product [Rhizophagus irregularis]|nr:unnamed protein product [Rhizophagus irregularis]